MLRSKPPHRRSIKIALLELCTSCTGSTYVGEREWAVVNKVTKLEVFAKKDVRYQFTTKTTMQQLLLLLGLAFVASSLACSCIQVVRSDEDIFCESDVVATVRVRSVKQSKRGQMWNVVVADLIEAHKPSMLPSTFLFYTAYVMQTN